MLVPQTTGGRRLDMATATRHLEFANSDYARLAGLGITACRDGASWVRVLRGRGAKTISRSSSHRACRTSARHPGYLGPFAFRMARRRRRLLVLVSRRFARYAASFARWLSTETERYPSSRRSTRCRSWPGQAGRAVHVPFRGGARRGAQGATGARNPRGHRAIRDVRPGPASSTGAGDPHRAPPGPPEDLGASRVRRASPVSSVGHAAASVAVARGRPELPRHHRRELLSRQPVHVGRHHHRDGDPRYRPFSQMLLDVWRRFDQAHDRLGDRQRRARSQRRGFVTSRECIVALRAGCELHGVTLYPVLNHPGWVDDRHCTTASGITPTGTVSARPTSPWERSFAQRGRLRAARSDMLRVAHQGREQGATDEPSARPRETGEHAARAQRKPVAAARRSLSFAVRRPSSQERGSHAVLRGPGVRLVVRLSLDHRVRGRSPRSPPVLRPPART